MSTKTRNADYERLVGALRENPEPLIAWAVDSIAYLGSKPEWSMDDNFNTTESIVQVPVRYGLPAGGDQTDEALRFYRSIAEHLGYGPDELGYDEDEED